MTRHAAELAELSRVTGFQIAVVRHKPEDGTHADAFVCVVNTPDGPVPTFVTPKILGHRSNLLWLLRRYGRPASRGLTADDRRHIKALLRAITSDMALPHA